MASGRPSEHVASSTWPPGQAAAACERGRKTTSRGPQRARAGLTQHEAGDQLVARVDEWLAEGPDIDDDGLWSERSPNYAAAVSGPSFLTLAAVLGRESLVDPVRRFVEVFETVGTRPALTATAQDHDCVTLPPFHGEIAVGPWWIPDESEE